MIKRSAVVVVFFLTMFLVTILNAQSETFDYVDMDSISDGFARIEQDSAKANTPYETLVDKLNDIKQLQTQIKTCIQSSQEQLEKINTLFKSIDVHIVDKQTYNYLLAEKTKQLNKITHCSFFKYRLDEIHGTMIVHLSKLSHTNLFVKTSILWSALNPVTLFDTSLNVQALFQQSGLEQLNQAQWIGLVLVSLFGFTMAWAIFRVNVRRLKSTQTRLDLLRKIVSKSLVFLLPLTLAILYLHIMLYPLGLSPLMVALRDGLLIYCMTLFIIQLVSRLLVDENGWPAILIWFNGLILFFSEIYIVVIYLVMFHHDSDLTHFVHFRVIAYCIVIARVTVALLANNTAFLAQQAGNTLQKKQLW